MHRFFLLETAITVGAAVDLSPLAPQLHTVLRLAPGGEIIVMDGSEECEYLVILESVTRHAAGGRIVRQQRRASEPAVALTLYQSALKADKFEWVLQKGTELGVACFTPVISERSIVRPAAALLKKYDRWRAIVREAAEQSGRMRIPRLAEPLAWADAVDRAPGLRIMPWETAAQRVDVPGVGSLIAPHTAEEQTAISLAIGPEGGWSAAEAAAAEAAGWQLGSLGPRILRAETAALAAVTIVLDRLGALDGPIL